MSWRAGVGASSQPQEDRRLLSIASSATTPIDHLSFYLQYFCVIASMHCIGSKGYSAHDPTTSPNSTFKNRSQDRDSVTIPSPTSRCLPALYVYSRRILARVMKWTARLFELADSAIVEGFKASQNRIYVRIVMRA